MACCILYFFGYQKERRTTVFYNSSWFMIWSVFLMASVAAFLIYQNNSLEQDKEKESPNR